MIIQIKNLKKTYKTHKRESGLANAIKSLFKRKYEIKHALKGINFEIEKGEVVGFIGPNGSGKSTTIKALSGVLHPTSGEVKVMGLTPWKQRVKYVKHIGVVFGQKPQLVWDLPAIDTFHLNKEIYDIPKKEFDKRLKYMLKLLNIEDVSKTPVRDLSLGERMKCKLVSALLHKPKLVFLDEPSIGLDVVAKERMANFIKDANEKYGTTFMITTHDMSDIERLCKRIIIIHNGNILYDGELAEIKQKFMASKIIDVKLTSTEKTFAMKGCKVVKKGKYGMKIEVNLKKQTIKKAINRLLEQYDVLDITITDQPIEKIIKKIYEDEKV